MAAALCVGMEITMTQTYEKYLQLGEKSYFTSLGKVTKIVGLTIESVGPKAKLNDLCRIIIDEEKGNSVLAEVVGFRDKRLLLMPFDNVEGIGVGCIVENMGHPLTILAGEELLGHTLDGIGRPTDGAVLTRGVEYPVEAQPPDPMSRKIIDEVLPLGVKAVDGLITVGKGQRIGIFAGSGVGKSTLLGMFARNTKADINVIALIGERGREVREFVERDLGEEGMRSESEAERCGSLWSETSEKKACAVPSLSWRPQISRRLSVIRRQRQRRRSRSISGIRARMFC